MNDYHTISKSLHLKVSNNNTNPSVTPIYQNSAFDADSPYFYTRKNNPNSEELEQVIALIEEADDVISVTTGMSAISLISKLLKPGDSIVINKDIYGCTFKFFRRLCDHLNITLVVIDLSTKTGISEIPENCNMVFFETPTNPFLKTINIASVKNRINSLNNDCLLVVDNTWATPYFQKPLKLGADVCVCSATKFFSGHSDVMGGLVSTNNKKIAARLREERFYNGMILAPHSAWLLRRSMQTFGLRMDAHQTTMKEMYLFLKELPQVESVCFPEIDDKQLTGYGCILFFKIRNDLVDKYQLLIDELTLFETGTGMACVTSMVAQPYTGSHASMTDEEKKEMGLERNLIRLCFGLENIEDLKNDLGTALRSIDT